ncbi:MAG: glycosyltransferase family 4 protein [Ruminococcus sp.]|jgi:1,2-diacylglycerol 3-alpha-glucosyltransferase|nr:glycosyltransferase family 4 protein [Ruminococcus sp.]
MAKVVNICLYGPVTDGWSYQDNLLPKYQKENGNDVTVITSKWIWNSDGKLVKTDRKDYYNEYGIHTIRLDIKGDKALTSKFKRFYGLYSQLEKEKPDIIFVHCFQFLDIDEVIRYAKKHVGVIIYVDNHCDFSNSATNWISKNILHKIVWKSKAKKLNPYVKKFYGVIPARVDFLAEMYDLPREKIELLEMGADDEKVQIAADKNKISNLRKKYAIKDSDFLIVTGGKIDQAKQQTLLLMEAVKELSHKFPVKLIVFGSVSNELKDKVNKLSDGTIVNYIGWIQPDDSYDFFSAADLVVFPGRHSVFWEQVVGIGKPLVVKYWDGTTHIQVNGNVVFLYNDTVEDIVRNIEQLLKNEREAYNLMLERAQSKAREKFSYRYIAERSIGQDRAD